MAQILIVDDIKNTRALISTHLRRQGHETRVAADGVEALELIRQSRPELVISDVLMPRMNGFELCRQCRQDSALATIPFIFFSGNKQEDEQASRGLRLGADRFLHKPGKLKDLSATVDEVLAILAATKHETDPVEESPAATAGFFVGADSDESRQVMLGILEDQRQTAEALRASERNFRTIFEQAAIGVARIDTATGAFLKVNRRLSQILGYPIAELLQSKLEEHLHPEDRATERAHRKRLRANEIDEYVIECRHLRPHGEMVWVKLSVSPTWLPGEEPGDCIVIVEDFTRRHLAEDRLRVMAELSRGLSAAEDAATAGRHIFLALRALVGGARCRLQTVEPLTGNLLDLTAWELVGDQPCERSLSPQPIEPGAIVRRALKEGAQLQASGDMLAPVQSEGRTIAVLSLTAGEGVAYESAQLAPLIAVADLAAGALLRIQAAVDLRQSEARYRKLVQSAPVCIHEIDVTGRLTRMNSCGLNMLGLRQEADIRGFPYLDAVAEEDRERIGRHLRDALEGKWSEFEFRAASGSLYASSFVPLSADDGSVSSLMGITRDITSSREAEERIRRHVADLERWETIFADAKWGIAAVAPDTGVIMLANETFARMHGYSLADVRAMNLTDFFAPESVGDLASLVAQAEEQGHLRYESIHRRRDGSVFPCETLVTVYRDHEGKVKFRAASFLDITERRRREEREHVLADLARQLNNCDDVVSSARHIVAAADRLIGWDACSLDLYSELHDRVDFVYAMDIVDGERREVEPVYTNAPPTARIRRVIKDGPFRVLRSVQEPPPVDALNFGDKSRPSASIIYLPVRRGSTTVGILSLHSYEHDAYSEADLEMSRMLAEHCASALHRIRAQQSLAASEAFAHGTLDALTSHIAILDEDGIILAVNRAWLEFTRAHGAPRAERFVGQPYLPRVGLGAPTNSETLAELAAAVRDACACRSEGFSTVCQTGAGDPGGRWILVRITRFAGADGNRVVVAHEDVTDRRLALQRQRETEMRHSLVVKATRDGIWDLDVATGRVWWNETYNELFGTRPIESAGNNQWWVDRLHRDDRERVTAALAEFIGSDRSSWICEYRFQRADGAYADVLDRAYAARDDEGQALRVVGAMSDITMFREREREIQRISARLREMNHQLHSVREEERRRISRELHDGLGQLLARIQMDLDQAERQLTNPDAAAARLVFEEKLVSAGNLTSMMEEEVHRIVAELRPATLDELGLVTALQDHIETFERQSEISVAVEIAEELPEPDSHTATVLFRLGQELLTNVARHAHARRAWVTLGVDGSHWKLSVADNGVGIDPERLDRDGSYGILGARERVAQLGGTLRLGAHLPHGALVEVAIPLADDQSAANLNPE